MFRLHDIVARRLSPNRRTPTILAVLFTVAVAVLVTTPSHAEPCRTHQVQSGQTLGKIAKRYQVTIDAIEAQNGINRKTPLKLGMVLEIPPVKGTCGKPARTAKTASKQAGNTKPQNATSNAATSIIAPPPVWTQTQKSAEQRGINPCNTPEPPPGVYGSWDRGVLMGQMLAPKRGGITKSGQFDVIFHFHGHDPVRREWVRVMDGAVLVGLTLGIGSGPYESTFRDPNLFSKYVQSVEQLMAKRSGNPKARARKIGLSAWSAGYGAVGEILRTEYGKRVVDSVILLDGLHCGYQGNSLNDQQLAPFVEFARRAAAGSKFMFISHSSIIPPGYASTTETSQYVIHKLGGKPKAARSRRSDPMGLDLIARYDRGGFHVRGYQGNDKMDHCAHIGLLRDVLKVHIKRRWKSPKGSKSG